MSDPDSARTRRAIALGLFCAALLLLVWSLVVPVYSGWRHGVDQANDLRFQLRRYQQAIGQLPQLRQEHGRLLTQLESVDFFHHHAAAGVVAAGIQNLLRRAVEDAGGALTSTQVLPEKKEGEFKHVAVNVRLAGNDRVLHALLYALETSRPLLLVQTMVVSSTNAGQNPTLPASPLNITLEVVSYMAPLSE